MRSVLLALAFFAVCDSALADPVIIGYMAEHRYHPLITVEGSRISEVKPRTLSLVGTLRDAFVPNKTALSVQRQEDYEDAFTDKLGRYGIVLGESQENSFYVLNGTAGSIHAKIPSKEMKKSFFGFFSKDQWGRHFAESADTRDPIRVLESEGKVQLHYATDLNRNGKSEVWATYRLMYGELGRMIWEEGTNPGEWISIANHCYNCD